MKQIVSSSKEHTCKHPYAIRCYSLLLSSSVKLKSTKNYSAQKFSSTFYFVTNKFYNLYPGTWPTWIWTKCHLTPIMYGYGGFRHWQQHYIVISSLKFNTITIWIRDHRCRKQPYLGRNAPRSIKTCELSTICTRLA